MRVQVKKGSLVEYASEAAVVTLFEGETELKDIAALFDERAKGLLSEIMLEGDFTGKANQMAIIYTRNNLSAKRIVMVGLGKRIEFSTDRLRQAFARVAQQIRSLNISEFSTSFNIRNIDVPLERMAEAAVEGAILGLYQFLQFKTVDRVNDSAIARFKILAEDARTYKVIRSAVKTAEIISDAANFARDLVSAPANEMTPSRLAEKTKERVKGKKIRCTVLDSDRMKRIGMKALLGVSRGSDEPPQLIVLEYWGGKKSNPLIALVGKGITFDSGGISLKPSENMDQMKSDMAGGAAVIAGIGAAADLSLPVNLVGIIPATENLPSGKAYKPGDIFKSLSGQTIEIVTTDAEGRLILADALTYAGRRYKPAAIIDLATLTGACIVALGDHVTGMMGTDDCLKREIRAAAETTGEKVWELPLWQEYHELIKGDAADYKNSGGKAGGAITAAAFLSKFTSGIPWVHLDIAGPAWLSKEKPYIPKGASGVGVRLLIQFLRNRH